MRLIIRRFISYCYNFVILLSATYVTWTVWFICFSGFVICNCTLLWKIWIKSCNRFIFYLNVKDILNLKTRYIQSYVYFDVMNLFVPIIFKYNLILKDDRHLISCSVLSICLCYKLQAFSGYWHNTFYCYAHSTVIF